MCLRRAQTQDAGRRKTTKKSNCDNCRPSWRHELGLWFLLAAPLSRPCCLGALARLNTLRPCPSFPSNCRLRFGVTVLVCPFCTTLIGVSCVIRHRPAASLLFAAASRRILEGDPLAHDDMNIQR